ncbi:hypothetical protein BDW74DRAFT_40159 [Aspergillus multicolor]|uniref:class II aldolase/adducin family protein n=1 Tax=Aspergillus multicolor TaxID=41759 RepID=UPI003CCDBD54
MSTTNSPSKPSILRMLITGSHILHQHGILDAYGHLSVRHPDNKDTFLMPRNMAPALISSPSDIVEYYVDDACPVDSASPTGYVERFIHSEIYKRYPDIQSVVHSHSAAILPFTITDIELRPCVHMAGFLVPKFDISRFYADHDTRDLLIRNQRLGQHLSARFSAGAEKPYHPIVLMRGHGFTVAGGKIEETVFRAIYTAENARVQAAAHTLQLAADVASSKENESDELYYLHDDELLSTTQMGQWSVMRPWELWVRETEVNPLYLNNA